jgi:DNA-binding transcriptional LysR family regulator
MNDGNWDIKSGTDIDLRHLRYFVTVARERSISKAARVLFTSQPSLGRQLKDLETRLGFPLFDRRQKSFHLTAPGAALYEDSLRLLKHWENWKKDVADAAETPPDKFRLLVSEYMAGSSMFADYLQILQKTSSVIPIEVIDTPEEPVAAALLDGEYDFTFGIEQHDMRNIESIEVGRARMSAYLPFDHPLAQKEELTVRDLSNVPLVECDKLKYPRLHGFVHEHFTNEGLRPNVMYEVARISTAFDLVQSGAACFLNCGLGFEGLGRNFVRRKIADMPRITLYLSWLHDRVATANCDLLRALDQAREVRTRNLEVKNHELALTA